MTEYVEPWLRVAWEVYRQQPLPVDMGAAELAEFDGDIRDQAFFSSRVESARFLQRAQNLIFDFLAQSTEEVIGPDGVKRRALVVGGRAHFVALMRDFMVREGMATEEEFPKVDHKSVRDLRSTARLSLLFETQVDLAHSAAQRRQGMTPEALALNPAWELVRVSQRRDPRDWPERWARAGGQFSTGPSQDYPFAPGRMIARKTDPIWSALGSRGLFRDALGVDRPPFAWRSGMGWKPVSAEEWNRLNPPPSTATPVPVEPPQASTRGLSPELIEKVRRAKQRAREELANLRPIEEIAREAAEEARRASAERAAARPRNPKWEPPDIELEGDKLVMRSKRKR